MKLRNCSREEFVAAITSDKADSFAKTFQSKADMQKQWDRCVGAFNDNDELMGAIITTISKSNVANLQLLHTFSSHRRKGVAKELTESSFRATCGSAIYFRVSAEPGAVAFYESLGFKFWGKQKSGCSLSMFKIKDTDIRNGIYDDCDPTVHKALYGGRKGCLASSYTQNADIETWITD